MLIHVYQLNALQTADAKQRAGGLNAPHIKGVFLL